MPQLQRKLPRVQPICLQVHLFPHYLSGYVHHTFRIVWDIIRTTSLCVSHNVCARHRVRRLLHLISCILISDPSPRSFTISNLFRHHSLSPVSVTTSDDVAQTKFQTTTIMASTAEGPSQLPASAFSFTAPFPPPPSSVSSVSQSSLKQRRVSLALPSSPRLFNAWTFRDDTGVGAHSPDTSLAPEKKGKMRRIDSTERTEAENSPSSSQSQSEKKPRKKWTMEETNMLVAGCNKVRISLFK